MKHLVTSIIATLLVGCASPDKVMQSYMGHHYSDLVANWGMPQQKTPDGQGGEIWIYLQNRQWTTPGQANTTVYGTGNTYGNLSGNSYGATYQGNTSVYGTANTTYTPPQTRQWIARRTFFINSQGIIYRYAWQGR